MAVDEHVSASYRRKALPAFAWRRILERQHDRLYDHFARRIPAAA